MEPVEGKVAFVTGGARVQSQISKSAETRPEHLANTGYAEFDKRRAANSNARLWMDPVAVGELILEGVRKNWLYIFTHSEFGPGIRERGDALVAAAPFLLRNPIFSEKRKP